MLWPTYINEKKTPFDKAYGITITPTLTKKNKHKNNHDITNAKAINPTLPPKERTCASSMHVPLTHSIEHIFYSYFSLSSFPT